MTGGSNTADALPGDSSATEAIENAVEESRREYDKKVETIEEIDDKAMRSVRTGVISLGVVASGIGVGGPDVVGKLVGLTIFVGALGVGMLAVTIVYGIGVYSTTEYPTGIGPEHRRDVIVGGYEYDEWLANMISEYDEWSEKTAAEIAETLRRLELVQASLSLGVLALLVSASMVGGRTAYGVRPLVTFLALALLFTIRTYLSNSD